MTTPFLGSIEAFGFNFPPKGWALCAGQLLPIQQNAALFSLLGTAYGGDGRTNFALPNLQSRVAIAYNGTYPIGTQVGAENHTLSTSELPSHTHPVNAQNNGTTGGVPNPLPATRLASGHAPAGGAAVNIYASASPDIALAPTGPSGGGQSHSNIMPYLAINYCIALTGIFPSRN